MANDGYVRLGAAAALSADIRFVDEDCTSTVPAAYFGCVDGPDGRPIGAYGGFGTAPAVDLALGRRLNDWFRAEVAVGYLWNATFEGQSNFLGVEFGTAPVDMTATSFTVMAHGYVDLLAVTGHVPGRFQPFLSGGLGLSHNTVNSATYAFPSLGAGDATIVPPDASTHLAWSLGAGVGIGLSDTLVLDVAYRFVDRGKVRSRRGDMRVIREGDPDKFFAIGATQADFGTHELGLSLLHLL